jgi:hypothetical protein
MSTSYFRVKLDTGIDLLIGATDYLLLFDYMEQTLTADAKARIKKENTSTVSVKATIVAATSTQTKTVQAKGRVKQADLTKSIQAKGKIKQAGNLKTIQALGRIKKLATTVTVQVKGRVKFLALTKTVQAKAKIVWGMATQEKTIQAKSYIVYIGKVELHLPTNLDSKQSPVTFEWYIPSNKWGANLNFHFQIDRTSNAFGDLELDKRSWQDSGFEYWNGSGWVTLPITGVANSFAGNLVRFQTILSNGVKYWRIRAYAG